MKFCQLNRWAAAGLVCMAALAAVPAAAKTSVSVESAVFVERQQIGNIRRLEPAQRLSRGDRVVTVVTWQRLQPSAGNGICGWLPRCKHYLTF